MYIHTHTHAHTHLYKYAYIETVYEVITLKYIKIRHRT